MADLRINETLTIPDAELSESFARSGGPGGQNVNKVASKAELRWNVRTSAVLDPRDREWLIDKLETKLTKDGELIVTSEKTRDQTRNREFARDKLAMIVRVALRRPKRRKKTRPTRGAQERRMKDKRHRSRIKRNRRAPHDD